MQLSILTSILQSRVRYAAQSRVLGQVQQKQQQQINSVEYYNNTVQLPAVCVYCVVGVASYIMMSYTAALISEASLERQTLASRVPLFLLVHFPTNECEISDFCL